MHIGYCGHILRPLSTSMFSVSVYLSVPVCVYLSLYNCLFIYLSGLSVCVYQSVSIFLCLTACLSTCLCLCMWLYVCVYVCVYMSVSICMRHSVCVYLYLSFCVNLSVICLCLYACVHPSAFICLCLSVCVYLSVSVCSVCICKCLLRCLFFLSSFVLNALQHHHLNVGTFFSRRNKKHNNILVINICICIRAY